MCTVYDQIRTSVNIAKVKEQIDRKKGNSPYFATVEHSTQVWTDYDLFPYTRFFRGEPLSSEPTAAEREAGWMLRNDKYYEASKISDVWKPEPPNLCFQSACSTIRPCHPKPDQTEMHEVYNKSCNVRFR